MSTTTVNTRGLSALQRRILTIGLRNAQQDDERLHFVTADGLYEVYGFPLKEKWWQRQESVNRTPGNQNFRVKEIGQQRYNAAKVAVYKATQRLIDRGLVNAYANIAGRYSGVRLTEEGKAAAETITANLAETFTQVSRLEETANLTAKLRESKPLETASTEAAR